MCVNCWAIHLSADKEEKGEDDSDKQQSKRSIKAEGQMMSSEWRSTCKAGEHSNGRDDLERDHHKHKQVHSSELLDDKIMGTIVGVENVATQTELTRKDMQEREMALIWLEIMQSDLSL